MKLDRSISATHSIRRPQHSGYLNATVEVKAPLPATMLLGPNDKAVPVFNRLMPTRLLVRMLFATPTTFPAPLACTAKLVLPSTSVPITDPTLATPFPAIATPAAFWVI